MKHYLIRRLLMAKIATISIPLIISLLSPFDRKWRPRCTFTLNNIHCQMYDGGSSASGDIQSCLLSLSSLRPWVFYRVWDWLFVFNLYSSDETLMFYPIACVPLNFVLDICFTNKVGFSKNKLSFMLPLVKIMKKPRFWDIIPWKCYWEEFRV